MTPTNLRLNRLESRLAPAVATWDGGGADNKWTTAANWVGDVAPNPRDDLVFPSGAAQLTNVNDFPDGTAFHSIGQPQNDFRSAYQFSGNAIALAGGFFFVADNVLTAPVVIGLPITLTADQTFSGSGFNLTGAVNLNGHALTVNAFGSSIVSGAIGGTGNVTLTAGSALAVRGMNTYTGSTVVNGGAVYVDGVIPGPVAVVFGPLGGASFLAGLGTIGDVTVGDQSFISPGGSFAGSPPPTGSLTTGSLTIQKPNSSADFNAGAYRLDVHGSVHLAGTVNVFGGSTRPGDQFILINNDGTDPVIGTFSNAPEGATIGGNTGTKWRISYHGGDGNDVVATVAPVPAFAVALGAGGLPLVNVYAANGLLMSSFLAYTASFRGGVRVATADVTGDGVPDIITAPGPGGPPEVKVFDGATFAVVRDFMAYDPRFNGGVFVAASLIGPDQQADIITGAGAGGGPHVKVFDGATGATLSSFMAYDPRFTGGVSVAGSDAFTAGRTGGAGSVITGAGPGGGPHVRVFDGLTGVLQHEFFAYDAAFRGGVNVAARGPVYSVPSGSLIGPGGIVSAGSIVTAPASNGGPDVRLYSATGQQLGGFLAYDPVFYGGVTVGVEPIDLSGAVRVVTGTGRGAPHTKVWLTGNGGATLEQSFFAFNPASLNGVFVG
jgi:hypothetical protein